MDEPKNVDPKVSQELISRLTKEVTNLRNENLKLQVRLNRLLGDCPPFIQLTQSELNRINWVALQGGRKIQTVTLRRATTTSSKR
jgi:hypothetical protein